MFRFIKQIFVSAIVFFGFNIPNVNPLNAVPLKYVSMNNQECKIRPEIININSNEPTFYPYSNFINKCCGSSIFNDPYLKLCVPDVIKNINVKLLNLISRTNETRNIKW